MARQASILIYGRDPQLLETRRWVLERSGHRVRTATELSDIAELAPQEQIGLFVLCHTLSMEECGRALALVHTRWDEVKTLVLIAGQCGCWLESSSEVVDTTEGPTKLLHAVANLVGSGRVQ
jgi:DNA-binding NtrC family response regulator